MPPAESRTILEALGCTVGDAAEHDGSLTVSPPSWRGDIEGEADLVEEVLRVKGYDEIPPVPLPRETTVSRPAIDARRRRIELVRRTLAERGLTEAVTFSFLSAKAAALFGGAKPELTLVNPISSDLDVMRPSALPNLVEAARRNADRGFPDVALFELGPLYRDDRPEGQMTVAAGFARRPSRPARLAREAARTRSLRCEGRRAGGARRCGRADRQSADRRRPAALVSPRARRHSAARGERARPFRRTPSGCAGGFRREGADCRVRGVSRRRAAAARARGAQLGAGRRCICRYSSRSSAISRLSSIATCRPRRCCAPRAGVDRKLVSDIRLFDVYEGKGLPEGKKSLAIAVTLQPQEATLTDAEIEAFSKRLVAAVEKATGGTLRG